MVELEIDGQTIQVPEGTSIIEAADSVGIYIPRYCYHKKLSIAANCRMCLVEVEKVGKPLPACATPVTPGMKVMTQSEKALTAQRAVLEFLLVNHPLDCPVCDQGGMCELQDYSIGYGHGQSFMKEPKLSVQNKDIGPLVETWMTRCIKCTRCVRFGEEIAGLKELGVINRGDRAEISTYVSHFVDSELSGNITDICPVGALTPKPSRYKARNWELTEHAMIAAHDCVGSNIYVHTKGNATTADREVIAAVPRENESLNESWNSDRDRFSYSGITDDQRCLSPMAKQNGQWKKVTWKRALSEIVDRMRAIIENQGADQLAFLASPNATTESLYLLQKMARELGSHNVDHRLRQQDFTGTELLATPAMPISFDELQSCDQVVLIGSHIRHEQPILSHRLLQATLDQTQVHAINPIDFDFNFDVNHKVVTADVVMAVAELAKALGVEHDALQAIAPSEQAVAIANALKRGEQKALVLGAYALEHPMAHTIKALAELMAKQFEIHVVCLTAGCNTAGAWHAGAVPHRDASGRLLSSPGKDIQSLFSDEAVRGYFIYHFEPEHDVSLARGAMQALKQAGLVVYFSAYETEAMRSVADFILPISALTETAGTFINVTGKAQSFVASSVPHGDSKPGWKVLRALGSWLELPGFEFQTSQDVMNELNAIDKQVEPQSSNDNFHISKVTGWQRYACQPIYAIDNVVRRAQPLQQTNLAEVACLSLNAKMASEIGVSEGDSLTAVQAEQDITLPVRIDNAIADGVVRLPASLPETQGFGLGHGEITLKGVS